MAEEQLLYNLIGKCSNVKMLSFLAAVDVRRLSPGFLANLQALDLVKSSHGASLFLRFLRYLPYSLRDLSLQCIRIIGRLSAQNGQPSESGLVAAMQYISKFLSLHRLVLFHVTGYGQQFLQSLHGQTRT